MTDLGVDLLCKNTKLVWVSIAGRISAEAVEKLGGLPRLSSLSVWSDLVSKDEREALKAKLAHLSLGLRDFYPATGKFSIGKDGVWRLNVDGDREKLDSIEGKPVKDLLGKTITKKLESEIKGKVVLIDFWGVWCGPCIAMKPTLAKHLEENEKSGFVVLSVHSDRGQEKLDDYLKEHPMKWTNLVDTDGKLEKSFAVNRFPSFFLIDRNGILRVAQPHRIKLGEAIKTLLDEL